MDFAGISANSGWILLSTPENAGALKEKAVFSGAKWGGIKAACIKRELRSDNSLPQSDLCAIQNEGAKSILGRTPRR
jgi:hypothetical protein